MKFVKIDEDAYEVTMNLDTIQRISAAFSVANENGDGSGDARDTVLGVSFLNAHQRLSNPETSEEVVETSDSE